jgi:hypothetical protein
MKNYTTRLLERGFSVFHYFFVSFFFLSKNGSALSAVMGASAKRAHRLQERRSCVVI